MNIEIDENLIKKEVKRERAKFRNITVNVSDEDYQRIKLDADKFMNGNIAKFVRMILNATKIKET